MKTRLLVFLLLVGTLNSCKGQGAGTGKAVIEVHGDSILQNYSYKGYDVSPFVYGQYVIPFNIGDEYLVQYEKERWGKETVLEKHTIVDTVSVSFRYYSNSESRIITIPVFEDGSTCYSGYLYRMMFFKGFNSYNSNYLKSPPTDEQEGMDGDNKLFWSMVQGGKQYYYTDEVLNDGQVNEITYSVDSKKQVLVRQYAKINYLETYSIFLATDLDGDGINDIILQTGNSIYIKTPEWKEFNEARKAGTLPNSSSRKVTSIDEVVSLADITDPEIERIDYISFMLFLSSEAEEGEVLKHVATKTFEYKRFFTTYIED